MSDRHQLNSTFYERLSPENAALLLIDHQTGLMLGVETSEFTILKNNTLALAALGKVFNLPTILTTSFSEGPNGHLMPEIVEMYPDCKIINRSMVSAWDELKYVAAVEKTGRKKLIMAAITTDVCLLFPALAAVEAGYDVYAVIDASGTWGAQAELASMMRLMQAGVKTTNWVSVAAELLRDWSKPVGKDLAKVFGERLTPYGYLIDNLAAAKAGH